MAKLTTARRKALSKSKFALPKKRKFPLDTKARAANAKARAVQGVDKGTLSAADKATVIRKANVVLRKKGAKTISGKKVKK